MILHISPTPFVTNRHGCPVRLWWGQFDGGKAVTVWVVAVGSSDPEVQRAYEGALAEIEASITPADLAEIAEHVRQMLARVGAEGGAK